MLPGISTDADSIWLPCSLTNYLQLHMKSLDFSALWDVGPCRLTLNIKLVLS